MKKLNNKGFTLVELLAVVVILAIVMGIAASSVLNSINNSRKSTLYSAAQNAANTLNTWVVEDAVISSDDARKLGDDFQNATMSGNWICLSETLKINNGTTEDTNDPTLLNALGLSTSDIVISSDFEKEVTTAGSEADPTCSAIRYNFNSGGYELLLVAETGGKYHVSGDKLHFAYSRATSYNESISD